MLIARTRPANIIPSEHLKTSTSIPTKFETQINVGAGEANGFMNRTYRFDSSETDGPGSGHYDVRTTLVKTDSTSKKGYTTMASSNKRWYEEPKPTFNPPGPGNYQSKDFVTESLNKHMNRRAGTHQFVKPSTVSVTGNRNKPVNIGPGEYIDIFHGTSVPQRPVSHSFFKSTSKRFTYIPPSEEQPLPPDTTLIGGLGNSNMYREAFSAEKNYGIKHKDEGLPSAIFRSKTSRSTLPDLNGNFSDSRQALLKEVRGENRPSMRTSTVSGNHFDNTKNTSSFANTGKLDRFGRSTKTLVRRVENTAPTPGPGAYINLNTNQKQMISSSFFMSSSERFDPIEQADVGPGVYEKEDALLPRSFHNRQGKKWM